jgi:hypothetical protein
MVHGLNGVVWRTVRYIRPARRRWGVDMATHAELVRQMLEGRNAVEGYRIVSGAMTVKEAFKLLGNIDDKNAQAVILNGLPAHSDGSARDFVVASVYSLLINGIHAGIGLQGTVGEGVCVRCINQCWERDKVPPKHGVGLLTLLKAVIDIYNVDEEHPTHGASIRRMRVMIAEGV